MADPPSGPAAPRFRLVPGRALGERPAMNAQQPPQQQPPPPQQPSFPQQQLQRQMPPHQNMNHAPPQHQQMMQHTGQIVVGPPPHSQNMDISPASSMEASPGQGVVHLQHHQPGMQHQRSPVQQPVPIPHHQSPMQPQQQVVQMQHNQSNQPPLPPPQPTPPAPPPPAQAGGGSGGEEHSMVTKCVRFFKTLIQLSQQPDQQQGTNTAGRVSELVANVIYGNMAAEEFTVRLQEALKSQAQPHLLPFLQRTLPSLRLALQNGEVQMEGISPPRGMTPFGGAPPPPQQTTPSMSSGPPSSSHTPSPMPPGTLHSQSSLGGGQPMQPPPIMMPQQNPNFHPQPHGGPPPQPMGVPQGIPPQHRPGPSPQMQPHPNQQQQQMVERMDIDESKPLIGQQGGSQGGPGPGNSMGHGPPPPQGPIVGHQQPQMAPPTQQIAQPPAAHEEPEVLQTRQLTENALRSALLRPEEIMKKITQKMNVACYVDEDLLTLISDATEYRLRETIAELAVIAEHRLDPVRMNPNYMQIDDAKAQLKWLENYDRQQEEQRENREKEAIIRMSKSKGIGKDTLEKAKEMQRIDAEAKRNRDANAAAIAALGGGTKGKNARWDNNAPGGSTVSHRPRNVRVNMRDMHTVVSSNPRYRRSSLIHRLALSAPNIDTTI